MDCEALRTFLAIRECGGFSAAAARLGRSQPAISRRIALLEAEVGAPLFERISTGVTLSAAGRTLVGHAERILAAVRDAEAEMAALRNEEAGPVSLTLVGTLAGARLTEVLRDFAQARPGVALTLRTATSAEVSELVRRGETMIGLRYLADRGSDLESTRVGGDRMAVVCSPGHPLAGSSVESLVSLAGEHWLAFPSSFAQRETFADNLFSQFQARGIGGLHWSAVDSLTAQKRLAEAGFGIALLPQTAVIEEMRTGSLSGIAVADLDAENPVFAVVRRGGYLNAAARSLLALLQRSPDLATPTAREA